MQQAVGTANKMTSILMGAETIDQHCKSFMLVVQDVSVYDPGMSDSLMSAGRLMEAGYNVNFRILVQGWLRPGYLSPLRN